MIVGMAMLISKSSFAAPAWTKGKSLVQNGNELTVVCHSESTSEDQAREEARSICIHAATSQLQTSYSVSSLAIETDRDVTIHRSISTNQVVTGLNCQLLDEYIDDVQQPVQVWEKCRFDLAKARVKASQHVKTNNEEKEQAKSNDDPNLEIGLPVASSESFMPRRPAQGRIKSFLISTTPICDEILVTGKRARVLRCVSQPVSLVLDPEDEEIIIRSRGYLAKELTAKDLMRLNQADNKDEGGILNVFLQKL
jgi:hypothetical protein